MAQSIRWIGIWLLILVAGCGKEQEAQVVEPQDFRESEVAVWVDQVGITSGQIQREASRLFMKVPKDLPQEDLQAAQLQVLQQAVDNLVVRQLVKAEMERSGVLISREEIEKGKEDLQRGMGPGTSLAMLIAEANLPMEELEANLRLDLFKNKVLQEDLKAAVEAVTEETAQTYYDEHPEEFTQPAGRQASHILVRVTPGMDEAARADRRAKAEGIRTALLEGADFAKLAAEASDCLSRRHGGVLGVIPKGREDPAFEEAVYTQEFGEIGEVIETPVGFHVIVVAGEQEERVVPFEEVKDRLLISLKNRAQQKITAGYIQGLRDKATIKLDGALAASEAEGEARKAAAEQAAKEAVGPDAEAPAEDTSAEEPAGSPQE